MEARLFFSAAFVAAALLACGANYRSQNFIVHSSSSDQIAQEICTAAETYRRDLAIEWLGRELPPWGDPCPINLSRVRPQEPASGKTSFYFRAGEPYGWDMEVNGTRERVLDSVLPHEITHAIFATHFGRPLPRWADEGGSTTVEHDSEKAKQDHNLIRFLKGGKGIAFNQMFAMTEYPREMLPLYSQGYSLTRFLIQSGGEQGKRKFVNYVGDGMRQNNWTRATSDHYGYRSLSDLQIAWLEWVKQGSPVMAPAREPAPLPGKRLSEGLASSEPAPRDLDHSYPTQPANGTRGIEDMGPAHNYQVPLRPSTFSDEPMQKSQPRAGEQNLARPSTTGWYARQKDRLRNESATSIPASAAAPSSETDLQPVSSFPPQEAVEQPRNPKDNRPPLPGRKLLMEWSRTPRNLEEPASINTADERNTSVAASETLMR
ncbi:MAG: hypothetical protein ACKVP0_25255 [Pirellulaceae bacterium]